MRVNENWWSHGTLVSSHRHAFDRGPMNAYRNYNQSYNSMHRTLISETCEPFWGK